MKICEWDWGYKEHLIRVRSWFIHHHVREDYSWTSRYYFPRWWDDDKCLAIAGCAEWYAGPGQPFRHRGSIRPWNLVFKRTTQFGGLDI